VGAIAAPSRRARKALGAWYTPDSVVRGLLDLTLQPAIDAACASEDPRRALLAMRVLDPSCGDGAFIIPAARRIIAAAARLGAPDLGLEIVERCVVGVDIDGNAAERCARRLRDLAPVASPRIMITDALRDGPALFGDERFAVVVGNPPYLNQLESATAATRDTARLVREWSGGVVRGYADSAAAFWLLSVTLLCEGGRCAMVLPRSILSARDAAPVRARVLEIASLDAIWFDDAPMFDASVRVCAPMIRAGARCARVARCAGEHFRPIPSCAPPREAGWSRLLPDASGVPDVSPVGRSLGEVAIATADFRDQYYGLEGFIIEDADARARCSGDEVERCFPRLITSGLIERDACVWGERPTRILKRTWRAPRLDRARMERETALGPWLRARLVPKVLLATQTRVLEPLLDVRGELVPCVPVITITPKPDDPRPDRTLGLIHRSLLSPIATAFAAREYAGAALSPGAIKLAARQVLTLPLVEDDAPVVDGVAEWFACRLAR
jgi:hypothetical protein